MMFATATRTTFERSSGRPAALVLKLREANDGGEAAMTGSSLRIGSIFGIPIRIHVTFLIVLPLLALEFGRIYTEAARAANVPAEQLEGSPYLWGLAVSLALFLSVLVHELAHSLYALSRGGRVRDITLLMIGGVSQISELPKTGRHEALMALVGPAASLALGGVFYVLFQAASGSGLFNLEFALFHLTFLNVVLGVFNLLPAFPMDGGRIVRGVLAERWGILRATRVAAGAGKVFAIVFAILGFLTINILLMVVAFFVYLGAEAESRGVLVKALLGHVRVRDLVRTPATAVEASTSVFELAERMLRERRTAFPVIDGPAVVGVIVLEDVQRVPSADRRRVRVGEIARRVAALEADEEAPKVLRAFGESRVPVVPVLDGGILVGLLSRADVLRALQLTELEATQHPREAARQASRGLQDAEQHA